MTANDISGLVSERYCMDPRTCLYKVASVSGSPSFRESLMVGANGLDVAFASIMFVLTNRSSMYLRCERKSPLEHLCASTPRK